MRVGSDYILHGIKHPTGFGVFFLKGLILHTGFQGATMEMEDELLQSFLAVPCFCYELQRIAKPEHTWWL